MPPAPPALVAEEPPPAPPVAGREVDVDRRGAPGAGFTAREQRIGDQRARGRAGRREAHDTHGAKRGLVTVGPVERVAWLLVSGDEAGADSAAGLQLIEGL